MKRKSDILIFTCAVTMQAFLYFLSATLAGQAAIPFSLLYVFSCLGIAFYFGRIAGFLACLLAAISVDYHFITPIRTINFDLETACFFLLVLLFTELLVSTIKNYKRSLVDLKAEAQEAVAAKKNRENILSLVAHDLRHPLTVISFRASSVEELIANGEFQSPEILNHLRSVDRDIDFMARMIGDLVDLAGIDSSHLSIKATSFDAGRLAKQIVEDTQKLHPSLQLQFLNDSILNVVGDPDRFKQILGNLISNAIKYGDVDELICIKASQVGRQVAFSVINRGPGIEGDQIKNIFDRFIRTESATRSSKKGLGLGLYIARKLIEAQGGELSVKSVPNEETSFTFSLPT